MLKVALVIGSLRKDSVNKKVAQVIMEIAKDWQFDLVQIGDLPVYNQDFDGEQIASYDRVRQQISAADLVLFVTPEHNRSVPAAVKNLIDITSRPAGQSLWTGKKVALVTASPGTFGGLSSGLHLRQIMQALGASVLIAPEVYLSRAFDMLDEQGNFDSERTYQFLQKFVQSVNAWVT